MTGGASGFGEGIAEEFVRAGARVIIADITADLGSQTAAKLGCQFQKADVTERKDWESLLKYALDTFGRLDIIINNAGTSYANKVRKMMSLNSSFALYSACSMNPMANLDATELAHGTGD